jgi:hypothetical protein
MNMLILNCIESIFNTNKANQELYRKNYFSKQFLIDTLQDVGFQSVKALAPTEEGVTILSAKIHDERGNLFIISVHHLGNILKLSARPVNINGGVPRNANCISITNIYSRKYIKSEKKDGLAFGNKTHTNLLRKCKSSANSFFEELEDEFKRRNKFI